MGIGIEQRLGRFKIEVPPRHPLLSGVTVTSLGTLASRVLGLARDMATAALFGLSGGGVMDAFVVAFAIPNLFRRLFGEVALTASLLPVLSAELQRDRRAAWRLASVTIAWLAAVLGLLILCGEAICAIVFWAAAGDQPRVALLAGLTAAMLPYALLVCAAAIVSTTLHALGRFSLPAIAPAALNICWLIGVWAIAPFVSEDPVVRAYVLAGCVLIGGVAQVAIQLPALWSRGFRFELDFAAASGSARQVVAAMGPTTLGLAIIQLNTLVDRLIAWVLTAAADGPRTIPWLGGVPYPLEQGAAAAIYYGERMYQFPMGLLGVAVATVIFPLLSAHAARGDRRRLADDLSLGLRLVLFAGVPAAAGLVLLADPIARLLFERGQFTPADTARTARMIAGYGGGVWAFCAIPVLVRGFYAVADRTTPVRVGLICVSANLALNLALVWPLAEAGLAIATSTAGAAQAVALAVLFSRKHCRLDWRELARTSARTLAATAAMVVTGWAVSRQFSSDGSAAVSAGAPLVAAATVYLAASWMLRSPELRMLVGRPSEA